MQDVDAVLLLIDMMALSWTTNLQQRRPWFSMGVRGATGNGGVYTIDSLALWSVTHIPPTVDDLLRGPFDSILSAVNASIADPRILLRLDL